MKMLYDAYGNPIRFIYDEMTDDVTLHQKQNVEPIIEHNKKLRNWNDGYSASREWKRVASIPLGVIMQWLTEDKMDVAAFFQKPTREQNEYYRRKYRDRDWCQLKTA